MSDEARELFDVVIYDIDTRAVDTIAGKNLPKSGSFHTVDKRIDTVWPRLNEAYSVCAVPAGKYEKGDRLSRDDQG